jgi:UDP-glucose 4-epimerase
MFADIAASQHIRVLSLRYFNPIGVDPKMRPCTSTSAQCRAGFGEAVTPG